MPASAISCYVATARRLAILCWHMITRGEDYAFARPSLTAKTLRALELKAGGRSRRGQKGSAPACSLKDVRACDKQIAGAGRARLRRDRRRLAGQGRRPAQARVAARCSAARDRLCEADDAWRVFRPRGRQCVLYWGRSVDEEPTSWALCCALSLTC